MPRVAVEDNSRMSLRIRAEEKAILLRAVALKHTDLTDFVIRHACVPPRPSSRKPIRCSSPRGTVCGFWTCWRIRLRQTQGCWLPLGHCHSAHDGDGMARRADQQDT